jgi:Na+/H+-dicarboxylate symporter
MLTTTKIPTSFDQFTHRNSFHGLFYGRYFGLSLKNTMQPLETAFLLLMKMLLYNTSLPSIAVSLIFWVVQIAKLQQVLKFQSLRKC